MTSLAIFASGNGTNMEAIAQYLSEHPSLGIRIGCVVVDRRDAFVRRRAKAYGIPDHYLTSEELQDPAVLLPLLHSYRVDRVILAGYLRKIPLFMLEAFPHRILNIHPALLPKYGGKGMYGRHVHEAVHAAGERTTGITIHEIDEQYDRGRTIFQAEVEIDPTQDSPDVIAQKVHALEHEHFPRVVAEWCRGTL